MLDMEGLLQRQFEVESMLRSDVGSWKWQIHVGCRKWWIGGAYWSGTDFCACGSSRVCPVCCHGRRVLMLCSYLDICADCAAAGLVLSSADGS